MIPWTREGLRVGPSQYISRSPADLSVGHTRGPRASNLGGGNERGSWWLEFLSQERKTAFEITARRAAYAKLNYLEESVIVSLLGYLISALTEQFYTLLGCFYCCLSLPTVFFMISYFYVLWF